MTDTFDGIVIGAGVVGLAIARALTQRGLSVVVLEQHQRIGQENSSRSSGIVHAGIYYPDDSLKARLCVSGRQALYRYCDDHAVRYRRCGKLLVATAETQIETLRALATQADRNGVTDHAWLSSDEVRELEPQIQAVAGLWFPATGIIDTHGLLHALTAEIESADGVIAFRSPFIAAHTLHGDNGDEFDVVAGHGADLTTLRTRLLINSAGLHASRVAERIGGLEPAHVPQTRYAKGSYFVLQGTHPFTHLVYPIPEQAGLGIHLMLDMAGHASFGPDVEWLPAFPEEPTAWRVDDARADAFRTVIRRYWPGVDDAVLRPGHAGIRPKLCGPGDPPADFLIQGPAQHGVPGLVNLFGIESPGLTACLAIADEVLARLADAT
jgi:L-2-hydroxyglutarate oxidase LhgO